MYHIVTHPATYTALAGGVSARGGRVAPLSAGGSCGAADFVDEGPLSFGGLVPPYTFLLTFLLIRGRIMTRQSGRRRRAQRRGQDNSLMSRMLSQGVNPRQMRDNLSKRSGSWLPAGEVTGVAGAIAQQLGVFWGGNTVLQPVLGALAVTAILAESPVRILTGGVPASATKLSIEALVGQIDVGLLSSGGLISPVGTGALPAIISVGVYTAEYNVDTQLYSKQDPSVPTDISRFDWLYLEQRQVIFTTPSFAAAPAAFPTWVMGNCPIFDLTIPDVAVDLEPGEALMLAVSLDQITDKAGDGPIFAGSSVALVPELRMLCGRAIA